MTSETPDNEPTTDTQEQSLTFVQCGLCGALVGDKAFHYDWHKGLAAGTEAELPSKSRRKVYPWPSTTPLS